MVAACALWGLGEYVVVNPLFFVSMTKLARFTITLEVSTLAKNLVRAFWIPVLGLWAPGLFLAIVNVPLWLSAVLLFGGFAVVYRVHKK